MIERLLKQFQGKVETTHVFDEISFESTTITTLNGVEVSRVILDMTPLYLAFRDRLEQDWYSEE